MAKGLLLLLLRLRRPIVLPLRLALKGLRDPLGLGLAFGLVVMWLRPRLVRARLEGIVQPIIPPFLPDLLHHTWSYPEQVRAQ